jgi:hypothetical protein
MMLPDQPRALRDPTMRFLRQCQTGIFVPYISTVVHDEIILAPAVAAARIQREIRRLAPTLLSPDRASEELAQAYLDAGVIPAHKRHDARHVAVATVAGLATVVSWNHRHLANERKQALFAAVNRLAGFDQPLVIHTPLEVMQ